MILRDYNVCHFLQTGVNRNIDDPNRDIFVKSLTKYQRKFKLVEFITTYTMKCYLST